LFLFCRLRRQWRKRERKDISRWRQEEGFAALLHHLLSHVFAVNAKALFQIFGKKTRK
jgi:hypothetical protein